MSRECCDLHAETTLKKKKVQICLFLYQVLFFFRTVDSVITKYKLY